MLSLRKIVKRYTTGDTDVLALDGIDLDFRDNEFVSILGQSGCGKTTMLNIIGGLDRYTSGDLIISGVSTKKFKSRDWDTYRNHSIGFVFQNYNLIPHQSVLSNVELALTLSGVSKAERRAKAKKALERVGLGDQLHKKPNQMSGGQMQRVAIARALVNDPEILLADEPTGALDSATSIQVMELLKEIAHDRLVIMVTHNPELAEQYSTRIIRLLDGKVIDDTAPFTEEEQAAAKAAEQEQNEKKKRTRRKKGASMSFITALSLSFNNLMTKKARTLLTSFAGSIGIIGIALILSISNGVQLYIDKVQQDTLSGYPLTIEDTTMDFSGMMSSMMEKEQQATEHQANKIYSNDIMTDMIEAMSSGATENNLTALKTYIEQNKETLNPLVSDIKYGYSTQMNIYKGDLSDGIYQVNPGQVMQNLGFASAASTATASSGMQIGMSSQMNVWKELLDNSELLESQYDILAGHMPTNYDEAVVIVDENNEISDYTLYTLGLRDDKELTEMLKAMQNGETYEVDSTEYTYEEILGLSFRLLLNTDYFEKKDGIWVDKSDDELYLMDKLKSATEIRIVGILRPSDDATSTSDYGTVAYTSALTQHLINEINNSAIVKEQLNDTETDLFTGLPFKTDDDTVTLEQVTEEINTLPTEQRMQMLAYMQQMKNAGMSDEKIAETFAATLFAKSSATLEENLDKMGVASLDSPSTISIYPVDFKAKESITDFLTDYNNSVAEADQITYTDYVGLMMSSVTTIISAISYILIAFVGISLVVSSIMIGIITYISVLERTKEIGILRAIGASKRDISRVFNAETLIVGFVAGMLGIGITILLNIPINHLIRTVAGITATSSLPTVAAAILVAISMLLTFVAGLIPSRFAAKKDPVVALRSE